MDTTLCSADPGSRRRRVGRGERLHLSARLCLISFYFMSRVYYLGSHAHSPPITKPPCTLRRSPQKLARTSFVPRTMVSRWGRRDRHPGSFIAGAYFTTLVYPAFPLFFPFSIDVRKPLIRRYESRTYDLSYRCEKFRL